MSEREVDPNDYKVVTFKNPYDFCFTPEMGCMYDGRPISGISGAPGINGGESMTMPYHIGHRLAVNLAKIALLRNADKSPVQLDAYGNPMIKAIWDTVELDNLKTSYITELYSEEKPIAQSESDKMFARMEEMKQLAARMESAAQALGVTTPAVEPSVEADGSKYKDKAEVIAELNSRGIQHDPRQKKDILEKLLTN